MRTDLLALTSTLPIGAMVLALFILQTRDNAGGRRLLDQDLESFDPTDIPSNELVELLDEDLAVAARDSKAVLATNALCERGASAVSSLQEALGHENLPVRVNAIRILGYLAEKHPGARQVLILGLNDSDPEVRGQTLGVLSNCDFDVMFGCPLMLHATEDENVEVRRIALACLRRCSPEDPGALERITRALREESLPFVRETALGTLKDWGEAAASALPLVLDICQDDPDPNVRVTAIWAAAAIGGDRIESVSRVLEELLGDPDRDVRETARMHLYPPALKSSNTVE